MALVIKATGEMEIVKVDGKLETLQKLVGGYIQLVPAKVEIDGRKYLELMCNEEGLMMGLPFNQKATDMFGKFVYGGQLVGDVVMLQKGEIK